MKYSVASFFFLFGLAAGVFGQTANPKVDEFAYDGNKLKIHFLGHGTLMLDFNGLIIHVDPVPSYADYPKLPKADIVLITHEHGDHYNAAALEQVAKDATQFIVNQSVFDKLKKGTVLKNGQTHPIGKITVEAVPAYNTTAGREGFHPKGRDNGYILTLGSRRVYIAGDTEDIPEMAALKNIDIAFLPMNQPYTMTPAQAAAAVKRFSPKIFYPYHFGSTNLEELIKLLKDVQGTELRIRDLK